MNSFSGTISELQNITQQSGLSGSWSKTPNGAHKFNCSNGGVLIWHPSTGTLQKQGKPSSRDAMDQFINSISQNPQKEPMAAAHAIAHSEPTVFIVYGHDKDSRDQLEFILTKLQIKHVILAKESGKGYTIIEALEEHIGQDGSASIGIVLLTPDDMGYAVKDGANAIRGRARQNVILEFGMIIAKLGRQNTIMVLKGDVERPSDTDGIIYLSYENDVREIIKKLAARLSEAGCTIDHKVALAIS